MSRSNNQRCSLAFLVAAWAVSLTAAVQGQAPISEATQPTKPKARTVVFISDTHFGVGKDTQGRWDPFEDFRWAKALDGFLEHISKEYPGPIDLVVLGDFLELWQPYVGMKCSPPEINLGCTTKEMAELASRVADGHSTELALLEAFSKRGDNHLYVVPGNHDSALLLHDVWEKIASRLGAAAAGHVTFVKSGVWSSPDGVIVGEHGHQIGADVNRYDGWPEVSRRDGNSEYLIRPWGEQFVQTLFNETEREYPIIDNLSPESAGARYRMADRGLVRSAEDLARFLAFNLFETSIRQMGQVLGEQPGDAAPVWDIPYARGLGYRLFAESMPLTDPFRERVVAESEDGDALRAALGRRVQGLSKEQIIQLCDHMAIQSRVRCEPPQQGAGLQWLFNTKEAVLTEHIATERKDYKKVKFFIYGHTHQLEAPWDLKLTAFKSVKVANTGAFHRTVDEDGFEQRMKAKALNANAALKALGQDDLPPCYTFVVVTPMGPERIKLFRWVQKEDGLGRTVLPGDAACR